MFSSIMFWMEILDDSLWSYAAVPFICLFGIYATYKTGAIQLKKIKQLKQLLVACYYEECGDHERGINPLHAFYITLGGCVGIANVVAVCSAIKVGGPGALFWMWVAAFFGMMVKYSEVYLGVKHRIPNDYNSYDGGPMYYFKKAFNSGIPSIIFAILLAIYGVEVYMFKVVTDSFVINWGIPNAIAIAILLGLILAVVSGGSKRVGKVSSYIMPVFLAIYCLMGTWVILMNIYKIPSVLYLVCKSAFTGHAAIGGFGGSSAILAISQGAKRACYTGDIGVGYAGVVCAETNDGNYKKQANLTIVGIFLDTFVICTMSVLIVLATDVWTMGLPESEWVKYALSMYFPGMNIFMPTLIFLLGFSSLIAFFHVGLKCMSYLSPSYGRIIYYIYATTAFICFSFVDQTKAMLVMSLSGVVMLLLNMYVISKLYDKVEFN